MAYPERGAGYIHTPKFLDRALSEEKEGRASGGAAVKADTIPDDWQSISKDGVTGGSVPDDWRGIKSVQIPTSQGIDTGDNMDADTSSNRPQFMRGLTPKRHGGRVRKGALSEEKEGRASGGATAPDFNPDGPFGKAADDRREWDQMKSRQAVSMPTSQGIDTGDNMDADTSSNRPQFMRGLTPKRHGGRVRKGD